MKRVEVRDRNVDFDSKFLKIIAVEFLVGVSWGRKVLDEKNTAPFYSRGVGIYLTGVPLSDFHVQFKRLVLGLLKVKMSALAGILFIS